MAKNATVGLVFGIISLVLWFIPLLGLPVSIVGLVLGIIGIKNKQKYAMGALICSIIGLVLSVANAALGAYMAVVGTNAIVNAMQA